MREVREAEVAQERKVDLNGERLDDWRIYAVADAKPYRDESENECIDDGSEQVYAQYCRALAARRAQNNKGEIVVIADDRARHVALIDTGADRSVMSRELWLKLRRHKPRRYALNSSPIKMQAANGHAMEVCGQVLLYFRLGDTLLQYTVHVVDGCSDELILGMDFCEDAGAIIDLPARELNLTYLGVKAKLGRLGEYDTHLLPLFAVSRIEVPGLSERLVDACVAGDAAESRWGLVQSYDSPDATTCYEPARGLAKLNDGHLTLPIANLKRDDVTISEGECVAVLRLVSEDEYEVREATEEREVVLPASERTVSGARRAVDANQCFVEPLRWSPPEPVTDPVVLRALHMDPVISAQERAERLASDMEQLPEAMMGPRLDEQPFNPAEVHCGPSVTPAQRQQIVSLLRRHESTVTGPLGRPRPKLQPFTIEVVTDKPVV